MSIRNLLLPVAALALVVSCEFSSDKGVAVQSPIIGGTAVTDGSWPAVGGIVLYPDSMCSGTLISPRVVVTAAHCVKGENPTTFVLGFDMENGSEYAVAEAIYNPDYDAGGYNDPGSGDVAVLVLEESITNVAPARIFTGDFSAFNGESIIFVGYGKRDVYQPLYGKKYQVTLTVRDIDDDGFWNYTSQSNVKNTCGGDSGGPGFISYGGSYYIGGFVSSGDEYCVQDGYNMRADSNAEWILSQVEKYDPGFLGDSECGNDICEYGEDSDSCIDDCPEIQAECGNDVCEDGESESSCPQDCTTDPDPIWSQCGAQGECPDGQFCIQVSQNGYYCTISCDDLNLGGGCGYQDMACAALQDGGGACVPADIECGDGLCEYGETAESCAADCAIDCGNLNFEGCCDGTRAVYCKDGQFRRVECGPDYTCGWVVGGSSSYYFCTEGEQTADPSGVFPMSCLEYTFDACGNGVCNSGESVSNCPADCKVVESCGNGKCDNGETTSSCPGDCKVIDLCGNGDCDDGETVATCPDDCTTVDEDCGNGNCDDWETTLSCAIDCPQDPVDCGNGKCDSDENASTCPQDCGSNGVECGDSICESPEDCRDCPQDCGECQAPEDVIEGLDTITAGDSGQTGEDTGDSGGSGGCSSTGSNPSGSGPGGLVLSLLLAVGAIVVRRTRRLA